MVHCHEFAFEGAETLHLVLLHREGVGLDAVLGQLRLHQRQGQLRTDQGDVGAATQQIGNRADVVLMAVSQHHGDHVVQTVNNVVEIGQNQIHTGLGLFGEEHATVNNQQLAVDFIHGHVTTDFAQAAQGHNAQGVLLQAGREGKIRFKDAHRMSPLSIFLTVCVVIHSRSLSAEPLHASLRSSPRSSREVSWNAIRSGFHPEYGFRGIPKFPRVMWHVSAAY